jgi:hypothetical protein
MYKKSLGRIFGAATPPGALVIEIPGTEILFNSFRDLRASMLSLPIMRVVLSLPIKL